MRKILLLVALLWIMVGCQLPTLSTDANLVVTETVAEGDTVGVAVTPEATAISTPEPTPVNYTLTIWGPESFSEAQSPSFSAVLADFAAPLSDLSIQYEVKAMEGAASLVRYLDSGSAVAPSILPDLILFPADQLLEVAGSGLLVPVDPYLDATFLEDLYPLRQQARFGGSLLAVPALLSVSHGIIRAESGVTVPPDLEAMTAETSPTWRLYQRPGESGPLNDMELVQLASLNEKNGLLVAPNPSALTAMLSEWQQMGAANKLQTPATDHNALYAALLGDSVDFIADDSRTYLQQVASGAALSYAYIPVHEANFTPLADGYLLAVSTDDPRRQATALALLEALMEPSALSEWSAASQWLPARRSALQRSAFDAGYREFADELLQRAQLRPSAPDWVSFAQFFQSQLQQLARTSDASPSEIARQLLERYPSGSLP